LVDSSFRWPLALCVAVIIPGLQSAKAATAADTADPSTDGKPLRLAQAAASSGEKESIQEVVVTGTALKRAEEARLPVQVLSAEDIALTGAVTVEDLLQNISSATSAGSTSLAQATGFGTGGIVTASLRGLGAARTLILINGQRTAVYGPDGGSLVDISAIPVAMIDHIVILKDGASSLYGSDAIAGVINFVMRSDYHGAEVHLGGGSPTMTGGAQNENASVVGGVGDFATDRYNATLGVTFQHTSDLQGDDRPFAVRYSPGYGNDVTSSFTFPANVSIPGHGTHNPEAPNCGPYSLSSKFFSSSVCRFDNSPYDSLVPKQLDFGLTFHGRLALGDDSELYSDASFWDAQTTITVQPVPLSSGNTLLINQQLPNGQLYTNPYVGYLANLLAQYPGYTAVKPGQGAFLLPPSSPYYPTAWAAQNGVVAGQPLNLIFRDFPNGLRQTLETAETFRVLLGAKGTIGGWDYDTSLLYSRVTVAEDLQSGYPQYSLIMPLLDSGTINPFGPTTDPNALAQAKAAEFHGDDYRSRTSIGGFSGQLSRDLLSLPAGPLSGAAGVQVRRETYEFDPALAAEEGDIAGQGGNTLPQKASRDVESVYLEFSGKLLQDLSVDIAGRYDHYQSIGSTTNPKLSINWQPLSWAGLTAAAGTGFRAPSLTDLYAPQTRSVTSNGTRDWIICTPAVKLSDPNNPACSFQFTTVVGGNPDLTPEKSQSYNLKLVLTPVSGLSMDFDSFWIFLKNQIVVGGLPAPTIMQSAATETQFASYITRDSSGNIVFISQTNANLFKSTVSGLDADIKYSIPVGPGRIQLEGIGTYYYRYASQNFDGTWSNQIDHGLSTTTPGLVPRWRDIATLGYFTPAFGLSVSDRYQRGYPDTGGNQTSVPQPHRVSPYNLVDSQASVNLGPSFRIVLGARNLFNQAPPYANYAASANNFIGGYDLSYGDPVGRFVYGSVTYYVK
jgi:iron complex outermembrane receptor protein